MHSIKLCEYRTGIKFDKDPLAVDKKYYLTKIVNVYIIYDLDVWPENCLFGATCIIKYSDKEMHVYSGFGIAFDGKGEWSFDNNFLVLIILLILMEALKHQKYNLILFLVKQAEKFV